jgi:hypothetical protein
LRKQKNFASRVVLSEMIEIHCAYRSRLTERRFAHFAPEHVTDDFAPSPNAVPLAQPLAAKRGFT